MLSFCHSFQQESHIILKRMMRLAYGSFAALSVSDFGVDITA